MLKPKHMSYIRFQILIVTLVWFTSFQAQESTVWQIGKSNDSSSEFAMANSGYTKFLEYDFGWEDRFYLIGFSDEKKDFPFVLPGATDYWGGTSGLAGIRPHEINILFGISEKPSKGSWRLVS